MMQQPLLPASAWPVTSGAPVVTGTRSQYTRLREVLTWDEREISLLQSGSDALWVIWTSIPKWVRALERRGWVPAVVQNSHVRFDLPPNAITVRSAKSCGHSHVSENGNPRRLSLGGDEISITIGDGPSAGEWDVLITSSPWGNKFQWQGWLANKQADHEIRFRVPENAITIRSRHAVENPTLRGVALGPGPTTETLDDEH